MPIWFIFYILAGRCAHLLDNPSPMPPPPAPTTPAAPAGSTPALVVSIVSHGHAQLVQALLHALAQRCAGSVTRVVLTLNVPEPPPQAPAHGWPFTLEVRHNTRPLGFGSNHNQALAHAAEAFVCVLNPDVALCPDGADPLAALVSAAHAPGVGCAYPLQVDAQGRLQDSERALPTLAALWQRRVRGRGEQRLDWVNGACLVLPRPVWQALGGFDTRYFMYCEDVDLCLRLRLQGCQLVRAAAQVQHQGSRASRRAWQPLAWHIHSLLRLWASPVFWRARTLSPLPLAAAPAAPAPATAPPPAAP